MSSSTATNINTNTDYRSFEYHATALSWQVLSSRSMEECRYHAGYVRGVNAYLAKNKINGLTQAQYLRALHAAKAQGIRA